MGVRIPGSDGCHIAIREEGMDRSRRDGPHLDYEVHRRQLGTPVPDQPRGPSGELDECVQLHRPIFVRGTVIPRRSRGGSSSGQRGPKSFPGPSFAKPEDDTSATDSEGDQRTWNTMKRYGEPRSIEPLTRLRQPRCGIRSTHGCARRAVGSSLPLFPRVLRCSKSGAEPVLTQCFSASEGTASLRLTSQTGWWSSLARVLRRAISNEPYSSGEDVSAMSCKNSRGVRGTPSMGPTQTSASRTKSRFGRSPGLSAISSSPGDGSCSQFRTNYVCQSPS